jgi:hypothetical protein
MKKNFTTKIMLSAAIIFVSIATVNAQTNNDNDGYDQQPAQSQSAYQDQQYAQQNQPVQQQYTQQVQYPQSNQYVNQQGYYYYPDVNVYYDPTYNDYMYNNGSAWLTVNVLPYNIRLGGLPRFMVYHRGPQVWLDNGYHRSYYGYNYRFNSRPVIGGYRNAVYRNNYRGAIAYNRGFDRGRSFGGGGRSFGGGRGFGGGRSFSGFRGGGFRLHR